MAVTAQLEAQTLHCDEVLRPCSSSNLVPASTEPQGLALQQAAVVTSQPWEVLGASRPAGMERAAKT